MSGSEGTTGMACQPLSTPKTKRSIRQNIAEAAEIMINMRREGAAGAATEPGETIEKEQEIPNIFRPHRIVPQAPFPDIPDDDEEEDFFYALSYFVKDVDLEVVVDSSTTVGHLRNALRKEQYLNEGALGAFLACHSIVSENKMHSTPLLPNALNLLKHFILINKEVDLISERLMNLSDTVFWTTIFRKQAKRYSFGWFMYEHAHLFRYASNMLAEINRPKMVNLSKAEIRELKRTWAFYPWGQR
jgi:hypothetical protein